MKSVCVFCGSSTGNGETFIEEARNFAQLLAASGRKIVYGGGNIGLMGILADAAVGAGGTVIGVIPDALVAKELAHDNLEDLHVVRSMHERKALMAELSDGFVALPGGIGTLEELFEIWTWGQLGLHRKPYGLLNISGFYDPLLNFLDGVVENGFLRKAHRNMLLVDSDAKSLLQRMEAQVPAELPKWIDRTET